MSMTLYEITEARLRAIEGCYTVDEDTGEIIFSPEDLDELDAMRDDKLEACGLYIKNLEAEETAILHEERKLNTRRKALQAKRERLMDYVLTDMMTDGKEIQTARLTMKPAKNPPSVVVDDVEALPIGYRRVKVEADKAELRKALKAGRVIPGARLSEGSYRLAVR